MMDTTSTVKGICIEAAVRLLLSAHYHVSALSVHEICPVLHELEREPYLALGETLRLLPDFVVVGSDGEEPQQARPLEVKYTARFTCETLRMMRGKLRSQQQHHARTWTLIVRGHAPQGQGTDPHDHVRILPPDHLELLALVDLLPALDTGDAAKLNAGAACERVWQALPPVSQVFRKVDAQDPALEVLVRLARALTHI